MADILIRGMEMPKDSTFNIVHIYGDGHVAMPFFGKGMQIVPGIEAVELPPHGRLIDADRLIKEMFAASDGTIMGNTNIDGWPFEMKYADIKRYIRKSPTIVPAEGGGE